VGYLGKVAALGLLFVGSFAANATVIKRQVEITASHFYLFYGDGSVIPPDELHIKYTVKFDNSIDHTNEATGLNVQYFNLPYTVNWGYGSGVNDVLAIASHTTPGGGCNASAFESSFCIFTLWISSGSPWTNYVSQQTVTNASWLAGSIDSKVTTLPVPEPASWAMMIGGFGLVGASLRTRRRVAVEFS